MKTLRWIWLPFIFLIGILLGVSCSSESQFEQFNNINPEGWKYDDTLTINYPHPKEGSAVNMSFYIKSDDAYTYRNLFLFVEIESPEGQVARDTLECILSRPDGRPLGNGMGSLRTVQIPFQTSETLPGAGVYTFKLVHGMRNPEVRGIHAIGLRIDSKDHE